MRDFELPRFVTLSFLLLGIGVASAEPPQGVSLPRQAANAFLKAFGDHPGFRINHAKGIVCEGNFKPSAEASSLSKATIFKGDAVPVVVRFSDGTGIPWIADGDPHSNPKGMGIRFKLPNGESTDIVANGKNGFPVGTPQEFVDFLTSVASTTPDSPKPTPIEQFLATHPSAARYLSTPSPIPASFATKAFFGNDAFFFVNNQGAKQAFRYQIIPLSGEKNIDPSEAAKKSPDFLMDEIKQRLKEAPVEFHLIAQLAAPSDPTDDATKVWPDDRKKIDMGLIRVTTVVAHSDEVQRELALDPVNLIDGIELSDDPLPPFRSKVYALSAERR